MTRKSKKRDKELLIFESTDETNNKPKKKHTKHLHNDLTTDPGPKHDRRKDYDAQNHKHDNLLNEIIQKKVCSGDSSLTVDDKCARVKPHSALDQRGEVELDSIDFENNSHRKPNTSLLCIPNYCRDLSGSDTLSAPVINTDTLSSYSKHRILNENKSPVLIEDTVDVDIDAILLDRVSKNAENRVNSERSCRKSTSLDEPTYDRSIRKRTSKEDALSPTVEETTGRATLQHSFMLENADKLNAASRREDLLLAEAVTKPMTKKKNGRARSNARKACKHIWTGLKFSWDLLVDGFIALSTPLAHLDISGGVNRAAAAMAQNKNIY